MNAQAPAPHVVEAVVSAKRRGRSWAQIAEPLNITPSQAAEIYENHTSAQPTLTRETQLRTQLDRLESYLDALHTSIINLQDPKAIDTALRIVKEISELSELKRSSTERIINIIDQRQATTIINFTANVTDALKRNVLAHVTSPATVDAINANWDRWLAEAIEPEQRNMLEQTETITL